MLQSCLHSCLAGSSHICYMLLHIGYINSQLLGALTKVLWTSVRNGDTYAGEYFADRMHGFGIYSFANGHRYEGAWHEGRRQGLGMYSFRNGETQAGHWQNGVLDTLSTQNFIPGSPIAVNHSKVLNAVQVMRLMIPLVARLVWNMAWLYLLIPDHVDYAGSEKSCREGLWHPESRW